MSDNLIPYNELTPEQKALVDSPDLMDVYQAIAQGFGLDKLTRDSRWWIRAEVANWDYESALAILIYDKHYMVRCSVARQGYGLDFLVNDPHRSVREIVASKGYGLDVLVDDLTWGVRATVAQQGYGLNVLINDTNANVRATVYAALGDQTIEEWIENNPYRCALPENFTPYEELTPCQKVMVDSPNRKKRIKAAEKRCGLNRLIDDPDISVRITVAEQGYGLDKLRNDSEWLVRNVAQAALGGQSLKVLKEWIEQNPDKCALPENKPSK